MDSGLDDISQWDVSSAADVSGMFFKATAFDGDLCQWDVSIVIDMGDMLLQAAVFNGDICASYEWLHIYDGPLF